MAWLVSTAADTRTIPVTLAIDGHDTPSNQGRRTPIAAGATPVLFTFDAGSIVPGKHRAVVSAGDLASEWPFEVLPVRAVATEAQTHLKTLTQRIAVLSGLVSQGRKAGVDVALPDATLATAELFQTWIPADLKRTGGETLARREIERLEPLVERAIAETQAVLARPQDHPAVAAAQRHRRASAQWRLVCRRPAGVSLRIQPG